MVAVLLLVLVAVAVAAVAVAHNAQNKRETWVGKATRYGQLSPNAFGDSH